MFVRKQKFFEKISRHLPDRLGDWVRVRRMEPRDAKKICLFDFLIDDNIQIDYLHRLVELEAWVCPERPILPVCSLIDIESNGSSQIMG